MALLRVQVPGSDDPDGCVAVYAMADVCDGRVKDRDDDGATVIDAMDPGKRVERELMAVSFYYTSDATNNDCAMEMHVCDGLEAIKRDGLGSRHGCGEHDVGSNPSDNSTDSMRRHDVGRVCNQHPKNMHRNVQMKIEQCWSKGGCVFSFNRVAGGARSSMFKGVSIILISTLIGTELLRQIYKLILPAEALPG